MSGFSIPSIKVGSLKHGMSKFDMSSDFHTTANWGYLQPYLCQELIKGSKMVLNTETLVRCAPLVSPTMSRITHRLYHQFVPIEDLLDNYENLLSGTKYSTSSNSAGYVPSSVPTVTCNLLTLFVLKYSYYTCYKCSKLSTGSYTYVPEDQSYSTFLSDFGNNLSTAASIALTPLASFRQLSDPITPTGADMVICGQETDNGFFMWCFRFSPVAQRLRKSFLGLGYQLDITNLRNLSALPLFAYYKAYFDIFFPKQNTNWKLTAAYKTLDYFRQNGTYSLTSAFNNIEYVRDFLNSFSDCWYTDNPDFVSAHIATPAISNYNVSISTNKPDSLGDASPIYANINQQPALAPTSGGLNNLSGQKLELLQKLYKWTNKNTVLGQQVREYLKAHYGMDLVHDLTSSKIGSSVTNVNISDVMSTSNTYNATDESGSMLGEYAAKGIGYDNGGSLTWNADAPGFWITLGCITPQSRYYQGVDPALGHIDRFSIYESTWDGLGFEITPEDVICSAGDVVTPDMQVGTPNGFGFIPRMSSYKVKNDRISGDMSRRSLRDTYAPYQLDKMITRVEVDADEEQGVLGWQSVQLPGASTNWRYPTKFDWLGNYNRIFANGDPSNINLINPQATDNFIVHAVFKCDIYAPMLPISESFESMDSDNIKVEKA